jgi:hypothetical protein
VDQAAKLSGGLTAFGQNFDINLGRVTYVGNMRCVELLKHKPK